MKTLQQYMEGLLDRANKTDVSASWEHALMDLLETIWWTASSRPLQKAIKLVKAHAGASMVVNNLNNAMYACTVDRVGERELSIYGKYNGENVCTRFIKGGFVQRPKEWQIPQGDNVYFCKLSPDFCKQIMEL